MPGKAPPAPTPVQRWIVPSSETPTLAAAIERCSDGTHIEMLSGHVEELQTPLIIDSAIFLEGPADGSSIIVGEEGIIVAAGPASNSVVLRRLRLRVTGGGPALLIAGGCTVDRCEISTAGAGVGVEVTASSGAAVTLERCMVYDCEVGISLPGGAAAAHLEGTAVEGCACGVAVTGLDVREGWSEVLSSIAGATLVNNGDADLRLRAWSVLEASGVLRQAPPNVEVSVSGWPQELCNVVAPTDRGPVVLHFVRGQVNATLFEEEEGGEDEEEEEDVS